MLALVLASPAGCGGGDDDDPAPQRSRTAAEARKCLEADGFAVTGHGVDVDTDRDAPDRAVYVNEEDVQAEIAFYDDLARAERLEPEIRENARNFDGIVRRIDRATVVWLKKPPLGARMRVERCVAAP